MSPEDVCQLAINLAVNCSYAVFPCRADKTPASPHGLNDASRDPLVIRELWERWPGTHIGVATGAASRISVIDFDTAKHPEAALYWETVWQLLMPTRCLRTQSGGFHLYYQHREGILNTTSKLHKGVDTRGSGGYVIYWFAAGLECLDHTPPAPFPTWVFRTLWPPTPPIVRRSNERQAPSRIDGILEKLDSANEGERNSLLFWTANRLRDHGMSEAAVVAELVPRAQALGLTSREIHATIHSAFSGSQP